MTGIATPTLLHESDSHPVEHNPHGILRVEGLSRRDFVHDFQHKRKPVIITDATRGWAARQWTPDRLVEQVGHRCLDIRTEAGLESWNFTELAAAISYSTLDSPGPYARNVDVQRDLPELWDDLQPRLKYATPDWKSSKLLPKDFVFPNGLEEMFFGGPGMSFPRLHIDYWGMDGFVSQLYGRKEFILLEPEQTPYLYPIPDNPMSSQLRDIDNVDVEKFPLYSHATPTRLILEPGETLYNPNGFWHTAMMHEVSITMITATWNRSNWSKFYRYYLSRSDGSRLHRVAMTAYLAAVGGALRVGDLLRPEA